ncbi:uncharacterized protein LOC123531030 [Mercenaria mercenaria]|uniref:uncharacterized protein LOC123531030 n=1 Tax=Mercenaria mercenaria TaxID=6596 RepID=UPI00234F7729|nr:uncharacterized protein LOC123531030 [Mercenaria mercenaria]
MSAHSQGEGRMRRDWSVLDQQNKPRLVVQSELAQNIILLVLLLVSSSDAVVGSTNGDSLSPENIARRYLHELCPGASVCHGNQTSHAMPGTILQQDATSCCTNCSCEPDCNEKGDCCFPRSFQAQPNNNQSDNVCLFPMLPQPQEKDRRYYQSYKMISDVPLHGNKDIPSISKAKCGDEKVAPWGTLLPVFSKETRKIYKNPACAAAANVTDGKLWDLSLSCKYTSDVEAMTDVATYMSSLFLTSLPQNCQLEFNYPGDNTDLRSETCFTDLISTCLETKFEIPRTLPLSRAEIRAACTSGLVSPYRKNDMYANVFCHICNGIVLGKTSTCLSKTGRSPHSNKLLILLDGVLMSNKQSDSYIPKVCPIFKSGKEIDFCRITYCPSGQLRDKSGKCVLPGKVWFIEQCIVYIQLTANEPFDVDVTFKNTTLNLEDSLPLSHIWPRNWLIGSISKKLIDEKMHNTLTVKMINSFPINDPKQLLYNIQLFLKRSWMLKVSNGTSISMSADWSHITDRFHVHPSISSSPTTENTRVIFPKYEYIYHSDKTIKKPTPITKLYFCDQIELNTSEFALYDHHALHNKITNRMLYLGEFTTTFSDDQNGGIPTTRARICVDGSGFIKRENNSVCYVGDKLLIFYCLIFILLFLY